MIPRRGLFLTATLLLALGSSQGGGSAEELPAQGQILATYEVDLVGFNLGEFRLSEKFKGSTYDMQADGRFSLLLGGLYRATGTTASTGKLTKVGPESSTFTLSYEGGGKKEARRVSFADGGVDQVSIIPPKRQGRRRLPVTQEQLEDVLDPLSAAFLHPRSDSPICDETIPVFDGRLRFDIVLTPKRAGSLPNEAPAGLSGPAAICEVKFVPIAGHRPDNQGLKFMSQTDQIEVWLVQLPHTAIYMPYLIVGPTPLGRGSVTLTQIKINLDTSASNLRP
jgi:hypothetical protein